MPPFSAQRATSLRLPHPWLSTRRGAPVLAASALPLLTHKGRGPAKSSRAGCFEAQHLVRRHETAGPRAHESGYGRSRCSRDRSGCRRPRQRHAHGVRPLGNAESHHSPTSVRTVSRKRPTAKADGRYSCGSEPCMVRLSRLWNRRIAQFDPATVHQSRRRRWSSQQHSTGPTGLHRKSDCCQSSPMALAHVFFRLPVQRPTFRDEPRSTATCYRGPRLRVSREARRTRSPENDCCDEGWSHAALVGRAEPPSGVETPPSQAEKGRLKARNTADRKGSRRIKTKGHG